MDIQKLYESIVLRDILEYLTPGSIILFSLSLITEIFLNVLGIDFSIFELISEGSFLRTVILIGLSYSIGHLLTGVDSAFFSKGGIRTNEIFSR